MKNLKTLTVIAVLFLITFHQKSYAHCEIPCGIYEDSVRTALIAEHITTIEKSMKMIQELSASEEPNYNQLVRWVMNKEEHAKKIQDIVSQYFMHQRIKLTDPENEAQHQKYVQLMTYLHELQVYAMKAKQTVDMDYIAKLRESLENFENTYFHTHDH